MRVSIFLVWEENADAGPGSLEAVEGVEPAASAWFRRWISAATAGEVSSEGGEGTMSGAGLSGERMLRGWFFWRNAGTDECEDVTRRLRGPPRAQR